MDGIVFEIFGMDWPFLAAGTLGIEPTLANRSHEGSIQVSGGKAKPM